MMEVEVRNYSSEVADKIQVKVNSTVYGQPTPSSTEVTADSEELPTVFIDSIEPGQSQTRIFPVYFGQVGKHGVTASLGEDSIAVDNERYCVVDVQPNADVLLIDRPNRLHSEFLSLALNPNSMTGIRAEIQTADFLRNVTAETLGRFDAICLCDVGQIDESAIKNLKQFTSAGGGLIYFAGPNTNFGFFNLAFYEDGQGMMPVELAETVEIDEPKDDTPADIVPEIHPIFAPVNNVRNSLLDLVQVKQVLQPSFKWLQNVPAQAKVIATVRGNRQMPLVIEGQYGTGRTMMFMTTAGPLWNNWMRNATFPPILLLLEDYMAAGKYQHEVKLVGDPVLISKPTGSVTPDVTASIPATSSERVEKKIRLSQTDSALEGSIGANVDSVLNRETRIPGVYGLLFRRMDSSFSADRIPLNVDCAESDLELIGDENLLQNLTGVVPSLVSWDQFNPEPKQKAVSSLNRLLLLVLVVVLVAEQTLGWICSYH